VARLAGAPVLYRDRSSADATLGQRVKLYVSRARLDEQIAAGQAFDANAELALRARQLVTARSQHQLARNLRAILRHGERAPSRRERSAVLIEPCAVRMGRAAIIDLAEQLERATAVNPRGMVLAKTLLTNGLSPLFDSRSEKTVTEAVREVHLALEESPTIAPE
jgi:hypothetical protein